MKIFDLFIRPVITEKATACEKAGKYQFFVRKNATKVAVRNAFKKLYGVEVAKVNVMRTSGKTKTGRTRRPVTKRSEYKKVIITTKARKTIDITKPKFKA